MRLDGFTHGFDVPDDWHVASTDGNVIVTEHAPGTHPDEFSTTVVLRESRLARPAPDSLAAVSLANLVAFGREVPGGHVVAVEALMDGAGEERRRVWALAPAIDDDRRLVLSLIMVQDLVVAGDTVAELTVTTPWASLRQRGPDLLEISESLRRIPSPRTPTTVSDPPAPALDAWASERAGAPREELSLLAVDRPVEFLGRTFDLSPDALHALERLWRSGRIIRRRVDTGSSWGAELVSLGFVDADGRPTDLCGSLADMVASGAPWTAERSGPGDQRLRGWTLGGDTLIDVTLPNPGADEPVHRLAYASTDDVFRVVACWSTLAPAWPASVDVEVDADALARKLVGVPLATDRVRCADADSRAFMEAHWRYFSIFTADGAAGTAWVTTPNRGSATVVGNERHRAMRLAGEVDPPFWQVLAATVQEVTQ